MKRFPLREFLWLCVPVAVVGAGVIAVRLLHPPRDPDAVIALSVTSDPKPRRAWITVQPTFDFEWKARAQGGPQEDIQLLYTQKLVALGDKRSQVIYQDPASPSTPNLSNISSGGGGSFSRDFTEASQNLSVPYQALPLWTKRVEWHGDFVAVPLQANAGKVSSVGTGLPSTFPTLARIKGAARLSQTLPVRFDAKKIDPIHSIDAQIATPDDAAQGADTWIRTRFLDSQRRILCAINCR